MGLLFESSQSVRREVQSARVEKLARAQLVLGELAEFLAAKVRRDSASLPLLLPRSPGQRSILRLFAQGPSHHRFQPLSSTARLFQRLNRLHSILKIPILSWIPYWKL
jgi:hypothetical protein